MKRKSISLTYGTLMRNTQGDLKRLKVKWEKDVGDLDEEDWRDALGYLATAVIKASYRLVQIKVLHRTYYTRVLLHKIGSSGDSWCLRGC